MMHVFQEMIGHVFTSVTNDGGAELIFDSPTLTVKFFHYQDCCESVYIEDVVGDLQDLVGSPITLAEEVDGDAPVEESPDMYEVIEYTFYKFATIKGYVDVRWFGTSNGYYSTSVDVEITRK